MFQWVRLEPLEVLIWLAWGNPLWETELMGTEAGGGDFISVWKLQSLAQVGRTCVPALPLHPLHRSARRALCGGISAARGVGLSLV